MRLRKSESMHILCRKCLVVHKQKVNVSGIVDNESFVARRHKMSGFLVRAVSDLTIMIPLAFMSSSVICHPSFRRSENQAGSTPTSSLSVIQ